MMRTVRIINTKSIKLTFLDKTKNRHTNLPRKEEVE